jgi:exopolysaccharide biosynthesis predicted pyruvyltransferase EpsI
LNPNFDVSEQNFKDIPDHSIIFLDDFILHKTNTNMKQNKNEFLNVVNYTLRHRDITLFLIIHNIYSNGLLNEILLAPHLFLAFSNLGYTIIR